MPILDQIKANAAAWHGKGIMSERKGLFIIESGEASQPFSYAAGKHGSKFLAELRDNKRFVGIRCPKCKKVYIPPRQVCGPCFTKMEELVELGNEGILEGFTILRFPFLDPETGERKPVPYGYGFIKLDGADTIFQHFIEITDEAHLKIGARVRPVFAENRKGTIMDVVHFQVME